MTPRVSVLGASGRMGQALTAVVANTPTTGTIVHRIDRDNSNQLDAALADCDVYIDFSSPVASAAAAVTALRHRRAAVIGTTGWTPETWSPIQELARVAPVVVAANFSEGITMLLALAAQVAASVPQWNLEIVEIHHRAKRDAPSGTALALAEAMRNARGWSPSAVRTTRDGDVGPRANQEIGVVAVRGGDVVGEHTVLALGPGERLELAHRATDRTIFARGALRAAGWAPLQRAGLYDMRDVLGISA